MVDLVCTSLHDHLVRLHREFATQGAIYDLPRGKWHVPDPAGPDLSVLFHGEHAATPAGPAAGPHGQMAQNIVLSYLAGGRIMELKTVQVNDQLTIPRPCIDATNVGYNVEWSQELRLADSLHEYVAGSMLVHVLRHGDFFTDGDLAGPLGDVIYDMSVGYDLAGIQSPTVRAFITGMLDASDVVARLRGEIPDEYKHLRELDFPTRLSSSITLSTFHGCPADEIERICEHLITEYDVNVIVKMNPPMLGQDHLEHLLHDVMGYHEVRVHPPAYTSGLQFDESVAMILRLDDLAKKHHRRCGAKFSNTLEVVNHRDFFSPDNTVMYLSGAPLYVITLALAARFRTAVGPDIPISYSAGIDQKNFADVVACGIKPVTVCTDLLRPGGYARMPKYLDRLADDMRRLHANTIDEYIVARHAEAIGTAGTVPPTNTAGLAKAAGQAESTDPATRARAAEAGWQMTPIVAASAAADPRYRAAANNAVPKRINSRLVIFDCVTCDKCIPVCPNDANFTYPLAEQDFAYRDWSVSADGTLTPIGEEKRFTTTRSMQIANYADYCNECGNCDTFCPEYGGPFIEKPTFFGSRAEFDRHAPRGSQPGPAVQTRDEGDAGQTRDEGQARDEGDAGHDGFHIERHGHCDTITGRIQGRAFALNVDHARQATTFTDAACTITTDAAHTPVAGRLHGDVAAPHKVDMHTYHTLRLLLVGVLDPARVNPINAVVQSERPLRP